MNDSIDFGLQRSMVERARSFANGRRRMAQKSNLDAKWCSYRAEEISLLKEEENNHLLLMQSAKRSND